MVDDSTIILNTQSLKHPLTLKQSADIAGRENIRVCMCVCGLTAVLINFPSEHTDPP